MSNTLRPDKRIAASDTKNRWVIDSKNNRVLDLREGKALSYAEALPLVHPGEKRRTIESLYNKQVRSLRESEARSFLSQEQNTQGSLWQSMGGWDSNFKSNKYGVNVYEAVRDQKLGRIKDESMNRFAYTMTNNETAVVYDFYENKEVPLDYAYNLTRTSDDPQLRGMGYAIENFIQANKLPVGVYQEQGIREKYAGDPEAMNAAFERAENLKKARESTNKAEKEYTITNKQGIVTDASNKALIGTTTPAPTKNTVVLTAEDTVKIRAPTIYDPTKNYAYGEQVYQYGGENTILKDNVFTIQQPVQAAETRYLPESNRGNYILTSGEFTKDYEIATADAAGLLPLPESQNAGYTDIQGFSHEPTQVFGLGGSLNFVSLKSPDLPAAPVVLEDQGFFGKLKGSDLFNTEKEYSSSGRGVAELFIDDTKKVWEYQKPRLETIYLGLVKLDPLMYGAVVNAYKGSGEILPENLKINRAGFLGMDSDIQNVAFAGGLVISQLHPVSALVVDTVDVVLSTGEFVKKPGVGSASDVGLSILTFTIPDFSGIKSPAFSKSVVIESLNEANPFKTLQNPETPKTGDWTLTSPKAVSDLPAQVNLRGERVPDAAVSEVFRGWKEPVIFSSKTLETPDLKSPELRIEGYRVVGYEDPNIIFKELENTGVVQKGSFITNPDFTPPQIKIKKDLILGVETKTPELLDLRKGAVYSVDPTQSKLKVFDPDFSVFEQDVIPRVTVPPSKTPENLFKISQADPGRELVLTRQNLEAKNILIGDPSSKGLQLKMTDYEPIQGFRPSINTGRGGFVFKRSDLDVGGVSFGGLKDSEIFRITKGLNTPATPDIVQGGTILKLDTERVFLDRTFKEKEIPDILNLFDKGELPASNTDLEMFKSLKPFLENNEAVFKGSTGDIMIKNAGDAFKVESTSLGSRTIVKGYDPVEVSRGLFRVEPVVRLDSDFQSRTIPSMLVTSESFVKGAGLNLGLMQGVRGLVRSRQINGLMQGVDEDSMVRLRLDSLPIIRLDKASQTALKPDAGLKLEVIPLIKQNPAVGLKIDVDQILRMPSLQKLQETPETPKIPNIPKIPGIAPFKPAEPSKRPKNPFKIEFPDLKKKSKLYMSWNSLAPTSYKPTLYSVGLGIFGSKPSKEVLKTGLSIRPIIAGTSFLSVKQANARRKPRKGRRKLQNQLKAMMKGIPKLNIPKF